MSVLLELLALSIETLYQELCVSPWTYEHDDLIGARL